MNRLQIAYHYDPLSPSIHVFVNFSPLVYGVCLGPAMCFQLMEYSKGDRIFVITCTLLNKMITSLAEVHISLYLPSPITLLLPFLSVSISGFEEPSCHESYSHKEINFAKNLRVLGESSREASDENPVLADTLIAVCKILSRGPS